MKDLHQEITNCKRCPRLIGWCQEVGRIKKKAFLDQPYWAKPVSGFGDPDAKVLIIGLAPGAHGANRTGRMFTGDNSGKWLYRALYEHGFANQPTFEQAQDGLKLKDVWITNMVRCAPPQNKPNAQEIKNCFDYFLKELTHLKQLTTLVPLGSMAWKATQKALSEISKGLTPKVPFAHGQSYTLGQYTVIGSYHPSQQNTFTKRLTKEMFDEVFVKIRKNL